jgi:hypothetical protein
VRDLAHQREQVAIRIAQKRHPQVRLRQPRDDVRRLLEDDAPGLEGGGGEPDVVDGVVEDRAEPLSGRRSGSDSISRTPPQSKNAIAGGASNSQRMPSTSR